MRKIPTLFRRTPDMRSITTEPNPECQWVFNGEGYPMRKLNGMACAIMDDGQYVKRREIAAGSDIPPDFIHAAFDETTGKTFGWIPIDFALRENIWFVEGYQNCSDIRVGTYELIGPKVQANAEADLCGDRNVIVRHDDAHRLRLEEIDRSFEGIKAKFERWPHIEGYVWHHPDGRMAKIKLRDFNIKREPLVTTRVGFPPATEAERPSDVETTVDQGAKEA